MQSFCKYKFYLDKDYTTTGEIGGTINPDYGHEKNITVKTVTDQLIEYLNTESMYIEVWGRQKAGKMGREKTMVRNYQSTYQSIYQSIYQSTFQSI